jgi:hypothetical protein
VELEPGDGCSRDSARCRHADELRKLTGNGISLECADDARRDDEDRRDGGERKLEAGIEERIRTPAEEHGGADEQGLPAITFATGQPRERTEPGGERSADDGRVEPDGERVGDDGQQSSDLGEIDSEAEEQDQGGSATADRSDLQSVDSETVVEAGGAEIVEQLLVDRGRATEHDRLDHVASLASQAQDCVTGEPTPDAVAEAGDSAASAGDPPGLSTNDRVDALPTEPLRLVETIRRSWRSPQIADELQPRPFRRRAPERELKQDRFVQSQRPPAEDYRAHVLIERSRPWRLRYLDDRPLGGADPRGKRAVVELTEPHASPTPGDGYNRRSEDRPPEAAFGGRDTQGADQARCDQRVKNPHSVHVCQREAENEGTHECVRQSKRHVTGSPTPSAAPCAPARFPAPPAVR